MLAMVVSTEFLELTGNGLFKIESSFVACSRHVCVEVSQRIQYESRNGRCHDKR